MRCTSTAMEMYEAPRAQGCHADDSRQTDGRTDDGRWVVRDLDAL
jgi:hypothetical protein